MTVVVDTLAVRAAEDAVRSVTPFEPTIGIILGTGLGQLAREIVVAATVPYDRIPGFPVPTVESHAGRLLFGTLGGKSVSALQGRVHRYEGYDLAR
ncbi:MAG TPA: purine-nucleoside phosphorylase, partial [Gemmatimonadales bacterium]|nr:purine-nucleoside phosphorylase [Gemmatimonadales bacterium]